MIAFLLFASINLSGAQEECTHTQKISCSDTTNCIFETWICDGGTDCSDGLDEAADLCNILRNEECDGNDVRCTRLGVSSCMEASEYCTTVDPPCEGDLDTRICLMLESGRIQSLDNFVVRDPIKAGNLNKSIELAEKFNDLLPNTLRHPDCPPMFTVVGDQCLSIFHIGSMSWAESREFCQILGGDLMTFRNVSQYAAVAQHLQRNELTSNFWIGGRNEDISHGWTWIDGSAMELGSPFWVTRYNGSCVERNVTVAESEVCYHYSQAPKTEAEGQCASLSFEQFFYMSDEDCVSRKSPLCVYVGEEDKRKKI